MSNNRIIIEWHLCGEFDSNALSRQVSELLEDDWEIFGEMKLMSGLGGVWKGQIMVKYEAKDENLLRTANRDQCSIG